MHGCASRDHPTKFLRLLISTHPALSGLKSLALSHPFETWYSAAPDLFVCHSTQNFTFLSALRGFSGTISPIFLNWLSSSLNAAFASSGCFSTSGCTSAVKPWISRFL